MLMTAVSFYNNKINKRKTIELHIFLRYNISQSDSLFILNNTTAMAAAVPKKYEQKKTRNNDDDSVRRPDGKPKHFYRLTKQFAQEIPANAQQ